MAKYFECDTYIIPYSNVQFLQKGPDYLLIHCQNGQPLHLIDGLCATFIAEYIHWIQTGT